MKTIRLKINGYTYREAIIKALAMSGYKVWQEKEHNPCSASDNYYICFELKPDDLLNEITQISQELGLYDDASNPLIRE